MLVTTSQDKLWQSYLNQTYRIGSLTLGPASQADPTNLEGFIISAWRPKGKTISYKENLELSWELEKQLKNQKYRFEKVIAVEETRAWVEDAFLIRNIDLKAARIIARKFEQKAFVKLSNSHAMVYETLTSAKKTVALGVIPRQLGCPAKAEGKESDKFCKQHGFWTTGQAMAALGNWRDNLTIVNSRLGCNLCNNVTTHPNNFVKLSNPEHINNIRVTNRFSVAQWVRLKDENAN
jgi:hypothetical protein